MFHHLNHKPESSAAAHDPVRMQALRKSALAIVASKNQTKMRKLYKIDNFFTICPLPWVLNFIIMILLAKINTCSILRI